MSTVRQLLEMLKSPSEIKDPVASQRRKNRLSNVNAAAFSHDRKAKLLKAKDNFHKTYSSKANSITRRAGSDMQLSGYTPGERKDAKGEVQVDRKKLKN